MSKNIKVLLVDDDSSFVDQAKIFLKKEDDRLDFTTALSARKGLELLDENNFDVIVSDYQMPEMNGLEFLEVLREERENQIPFIIFTGKGREEVAMRALNLGADRYIQKGGDPKSQFNVLSNAIVQGYENWRSKKRLERSEKELRESQKRYKKIFYETPLGVFIYDDEGVITDCNDKFVEMMGSSKDDLIGLDMVNDLDNDRMIEEVKSSLTQGSGHYEGEYTSVTGKKTTDVRVFFKGIGDEDGNVSSGVGLVEDISEKKEIEERLKESEEKYRALIESAFAGIGITDFKNNIKFVNSKFAEMLGYEKEELVGKNLEEIAPEEEQVKFKRETRKRKEGRTSLYEASLKKKNGEMIDVIVQASPFKDANGGLVGTIGVITDITERKGYERELKRKETILDHSPIYINVLDEDGKIKYHSYPANQITGLDPSKFMGEEALEFAHPDDREDVLKMFETILKNPGEEFVTELRGEVEDGWIWLEINAINYLDDPEIDGIIITAQDITERKKAKEELIQATEEYDRLANSMNDAIFVHDMDGEFLTVNEEAVNRLGYEEEEFLDMDIEDIDDPKHSANIREVMDKIKEKGRVVFESVHVTKNGEKIPVEISSTLTTYMGEKAVISVARDIKDRREREKELNLLYETLRLGEQKLDKAEVLTRTVEMVPDSFQYPELTTARIIFDEEEFKSSGYEKSERSLQGDITVDDEIRGSIEVYYTEEDQEEPFLEEERDLIEAIAEILGNIIERREREKKLKISERKFRGVFEASPDPSFLLDKEGVVKEVNQVVSEKLGYEREEIVGKSIQELPFVPEESIRELIDKFAKRKKGEDVPPYEVKLLSKNKDVFHAEINASVLEEKGLEGEIVIARDITERKRTEDRLNDEKQKIKQLYQMTPELREIKDLQMLYELAVELANNILEFDVCSVEIEEDGYLVIKASTEEELVEDEYSMPVEKGVAGKTYRKKKSYLLKNLEGAKDAEPTDEKFRSAISVPIGDIGVFQALSYEKDKYDESDLELAELFVSYITTSINQVKSEKALEESEKRYRSLIENSIIGVGITDFEENIIFANERFAEMLDYNKVELEGKNISKLTTEEEYQKMTEKTERRKKGESEVYETKLVKKDGSSIDIILGATPHIDAEGEIKGTVGFIQDISARKEAQEREDFLHSLLRHDIRNKI
ncbi:MAG: PAS domain S-box protein, partial [Candidatus Natronoplasma sp.]